MWMNLRICLNGWLVTLITLSKLVIPPRCLSPIYVLFMQDHIMRNNLCNLVPLPHNPLNMLPLLVTLVNHLTMIPTIDLIFMESRLEQLEQELKNYRIHGEHGKYTYGPIP